MYINLNPGQVFADRYRIVRCIGAGGMGAVFEAHHVHTKRQLAIKVMLPDLAASAEMLDRFRNEAQVTAEIKCDYITQVLDAGVDGPTGMPYMVMEFLQGQELAELLEKGGRLDPQVTVGILAQVAVALKATHAARIVHRDLKPENIFLTEASDGTPRVKILDFGISKVVADASNNKTRGMGTPAFMAPEQFRGVAVTPSVDIFAFGMIAYTMLTGTRYWEQECEATDFVALALHLSSGPVEPASSRAARFGVSLPPSFDAWFAQCTAANPAARFASAIDAVIALAHAFGLQPPPVVYATTGSGSMLGDRLSTGGMLPAYQSGAHPRALPIPAYQTGPNAYQTGPQPYAGSGGSQPGLPAPAYGGSGGSQPGWPPPAAGTMVQPPAPAAGGTAAFGTSITNPGAQPAPRGRGGMIAAIVAVAVLVGGGVGAFVYTQSGRTTAATTGSAPEKATDDPADKATSTAAKEPPKPVDTSAIAQPIVTATATQTVAGNNGKAPPKTFPTTKPTPTPTATVTLTVPATTATPAPTPTTTPTPTPTPTAKATNSGLPPKGAD